MKRALLALAVCSVMAGCGSGDRRLIGVWTGIVQPPSTTLEQNGRYTTAFLDSLSGDVRVEFTTDGRYKATTVLARSAGATGTYQVSGDNVILTSDTSKKQTSLFIDGHSLYPMDQKGSSTDFVLTHKATEQP